MEEKNNLFGCFIKIGFDPNLSEQDFMNFDKAFSPYIWGEKGISDTLKKLKHENYGKDLKLVLFQFYVKPTPHELQKLKEIESYRKNEKSIGIPIIINNENFFRLTEKNRFNFLKLSILQKVELLGEVVKKKYLDTNLKLLKADLQKILG